MAERTIMISGPAEARIIEVGDLAYKVIDPDRNPDAPEGRWRLQEFPRSMLIQFASEEDVKKAIKYGVIAISFDDPRGPR